MIKNTLNAALAAAVTAALCVPASLPAAATPFDAEVIAVAQNLTSGMDENNDGVITSQEAAIYAVFAGISMDTNSDGLVQRAEFMNWDPGFQWLADKRGTGSSFRQLKGELFAHWDANSDGAVSRTEMVDIARSEFALSDRDGDLKVDTRDLPKGSLSIVSMMNAV